MDERMTPIDPERLAADEEVAASLRQVAYLASEFYGACRSCGLPDHLAAELVRDWHASMLDNDILWEGDFDES